MFSAAEAEDSAVIVGFRGSRVGREGFRRGGRAIGRGARFGRERMRPIAFGGRGRWRRARWERPGRWRKYGRRGYWYGGIWYPYFVIGDSNYYYDDYYLTTVVSTSSNVDNANQNHWLVHNNTDKPLKVVNAENGYVLLAPGEQKQLPHLSGLSMNIYTSGGSYLAAFDNVYSHYVRLADVGGALQYIGN